MNTNSNWGLDDNSMQWNGIRNRVENQGGHSINKKNFKSFIEDQFLTVNDFK